MLSKSDSDESQSFLSDASNMAGGHAARVLFPETSEEVAEALAAASRERTPVTVAGAGTGVVGGRVPFGGLVVSTDRLKRVLEIARDDGEEAGPKDEGPTRARGRATAEAGVLLSEFQRAVEARGLFYPPDPTERSCYLGATVATNSSGARTFKYGPTRDYVRRLKIALATGDLLDLRRGDARADADGSLRVRTLGGRVVEARLPSYDMPRTRKHAAGYFVRPGVDAVDLFVGSEGTLGVITEVEVSLLAKPSGVLVGIVFFDDEARLLAFVREARRLSFDTRAAFEEHGGATNSAADSPVGIDARALEYFDAESLNFLREHYPLVPLRAAGAIFFEQETTPDSEDDLMAAWLALLERHGAMLDDSWFGTNEHDRAEMREFRHKLPVLVNEWLARHGQRKVSTDMAVPDEHFPEMLRFYKETLRARRLQYVVFGHVGDNHVHVNVMPRDVAEAAAARDIYSEFVRRAVAFGGTISAEHGVGKLKRDYLRELYGDAHLREMAALKRAFDPACVLGRGNIFAEEFLPAAGR
ncbi:MAG TPA: FAD-linked oxidase C-terminal domain-containing protein [Pyrinomonadaceae bacterium]|nr:FAD-linked oxidase C-terminal domain-containing protein [Pyrinomonadaceae bacterium]